MSQITLVIGNKNYSSWSLRPWLALKRCGLDFEEVVIPLYRPESADALTRYSPAGKVPVLIEGDLTVWDSLAICEYLAERCPEAKLWPADPARRAVARAIVAEMHSGFAALRDQFTMDIRRDGPPVAPSEATARDIRRILEIWRDCRQLAGPEGLFLFGAWSLADAFYAPVVTRFLSYGVSLGPVEQAYAEAIMAEPAMQAWCAAGRAEPWTIP